ncbi:ATP-binding cassette domain-containing protein [Oceanobacillus halotolerans]|uniref:ATP-binding cassette domain-containing protein n=1 Tax=Oceanobacillus halotolerans TaxID=2663380 RepID=UPI0013D706C7|nr:ATP-binding cassette domain-containing protein [Oceanobacillus halotolerans]
MLKVSITKKLKAFLLSVSFQVDDEIVVLFGPSGSGKTTILNSIAGLTQPDAGSITLYNDKLFETGQRDVPIQKRQIGYVFQDYALFPHMTVDKNIRYGMKDEHLLDQLIDIVGIRHLLSRYPLSISGGEKQRVALVRALATKPNSLLLDEPFSALDDKTRKECQDELLRLHNRWKIPIVMVTHDYKEAKKLGDKILNLKDGEIVQST